MDDDVLNSALREYVAQEPTAGLERRVLERIRLDRPVRWPMWMGLAFAAMALAVVTFEWPQPKFELPPRVLRFGAIPEAPKTIVRDRRIRRPQLPQLPRLAQFPTPSPMTDGERALLLFIGRDHDQALAVLDARREDREIPFQTEELP